jgi:predicted DNA-binding antitoxin AbrB/MazE fold protein
MNQEIEAVYENGVLRPIEPVSLAESQRVRLSISTAGWHTFRDAEVIERARAEVAVAGVIPSIEEVRAAMACIAGSMAADVIADRGEY